MNRVLTLSQLDIVRTCALLHDIGKLECWAERKGWAKHTLYTYKFVKKCFGEELAEHARRHHTRPSYPQERPRDDVERIVCLADHLAAGADRKEEPLHGSPLPSPPIKLSHVLSKDVVRKSWSGAELAYLSQVLAKDLMALEKDFNNDPREGYFKIFSVLEKSDLHLVPSDTREPRNDVSLWDHMKLTAAFATCIYLGGGWKGFDPESYKFALISGNADRISSFINESLRLPDLNARSELIKQATDSVCLFLRDFLGPECVLFAAGGNFLALAPTNMADEAVEEAKKKFKEVTEGKVTITTSFVVKSGDEFMDDFGGVWKDSQAQMRLQKSRRAYVLPVHVDEGVEVCDVCREKAWSHEEGLRALPIDASVRFERLCDFCWNLRKSGKGVWLNDLKDERNFVGCIRVDGDGVGRVLAGKAFAEQKKAITPSRVSTISGLIHRTCEEDFKEVIRGFCGERSSVVYAGGDDLLAFVPGKTALNVARKIALKFNEEMAGACTVSAGVSIFHYRLPVYVGLESANALLQKAKNEGENRFAFAFIGSSGVTAAELEKVKSRDWKELDVMLEIVEFMCRSDVAVSQLRRAAMVSASNPVKAEALIKYLMGKETIRWDDGVKMLSYLESGLLADAFLVYNLLFKSD